MFVYVFNSLYIIGKFIIENLLIIIILIGFFFLKDLINELFLLDLDSFKKLWIVLVFMFVL